MSLPRQLADNGDGLHNLKRQLVSKDPHTPGCFYLEDNPSLVKECTLLGESSLDRIGNRSVHEDPALLITRKFLVHRRSNRVLSRAVIHRPIAPLVASNGLDCMKKKYFKPFILHSSIQDSCNDSAVNA